MSGTPHVDPLFSAAYDGTLAGAERARFDAHLAACPACASAFSEMATAVDAVRELGPARMPRTVVLPAGLPQRGRSERRALGWGHGGGWSGLPGRHPWATALVGVVAAAAVVAAVLVPGRLAAPGASGSAIGVVPNASAPQASGRSQAAPCSSCAIPTSSAACSATPLGAGANPAAEFPPGFSNQVRQDDGITTVMIATPTSGYAPGQTVDIYARVVDDQSQSVDLPCADLSSPSPAPGQAAVPGQSLGVPIQATPLPEVTVGGVPLLQVTVPADARAGEMLQVVVQVPAGGGEVQAHQVDLPIQVT